MVADSPCFVVLGGPVPRRLATELDGCIRLVDEGAPPPDGLAGVLVHARPEALESVARYDRRAGEFPIYAIAPGPVDVGSRIQWIRYGADDLLDPESAAFTLRQRVDLAGMRFGDPRDEPFRRAFLQRWITAVHRYVGVRNELVARLGEGGLARFLDATRLRDACTRAADPDVSLVDLFGQRRSGEREPIHWPVEVLSPMPGQGTLLNVAADGLAMTLDTAPGDQLLINVPAGSFDGQLQLEIRWQRRVAPDRWEAGAIVSDVQITRDA